MKKALLLALFCVATPCVAQQLTVVGSRPPCTAFGTTTGTCIQGAGALGTPTSGNGSNITNVNASQVSGLSVGSSGAAIPRLDGTNTWSGANNFTVSPLTLSADDGLITIVTTAASGSTGFQDKNGGTVLFSILQNQSSGLLTINSGPVSFGGAGISLQANTIVGMTVNAAGTISMPNLGTSVTGNAVCTGVGGLLTNAGAAACVPSSLRYKNPAGHVSWLEGLPLVLRMQAEEYTYKVGAADEGKSVHYGFYAENVQKVAPKLVVVNSKGQAETVEYMNYTANLTLAIQQLLWLWLGSVLGLLALVGWLFKRTSKA